MGKGPFQPGARKPKEGRHRGSTKSERTEQRARRVMEIWTDRISARPEEIKAIIRAEFQCGINAASDAMARAYELYALAVSSESVEHLVGKLALRYLALSEAAQRAGNLPEARKNLDSLRAHLGISAPQRIELSGSVGGTVSRDPGMENLTDEQIALLRQIDERDAEIEAETKAKSGRGLPS